MRKIRKAFGILLIAASMACLGFAGMKFWEYKQGNDEYNDILDDFTNEQSLDSQKGFDPLSFNIDWTGLRRQNSDVIGWIRLESGANYPVLYSEQYNYYLHRGLKKEYNINGSIFVNPNNKNDWSDINTVVYGHNMKNGSMFGTNRKYRSSSYLKEHPFFYIYRPDGCYFYRIFNVMEAIDGSSSYQTVFSDRDDYQNYLDLVKKRALFDSGVDANSDRRMVSLSTCTGTGSTTRLVIQGYLEKVCDYKGMETSKNAPADNTEVNQ